MRYKWGDLISLEYGKPVKDKAALDGPVPVFGTNGKIGTSHLPPLCPNASFILGRKGAYRGVHYSAIPFSVIDTAFYAKNLVPDKLSLKWAYYMFLTYDINNMDSGSAIPSTDRYEIYAIEVELPTLEEQLKAVHLLETLDDKIELNQRINENLERQAEAIFKAWFADFVPFEGVQPKEWKFVAWDSLASLISRGITPKYDDTSDQIVLNQKCIRNHLVDLSLARKHKPKVINEKWLQFGDLLLNSTGEGTLGRTAQVWFSPKNMTVDSHITIVRPKDESLIYYIGLWGLSHEREIESLRTGSTGQTELPRDRVKSLLLLLPDIESLAKFNSIVVPMTATIIRNQNESLKLAKIRDTLLPKLMSGEIEMLQS